MCWAACRRRAWLAGALLFSAAAAQALPFTFACPPTWKTASPPASGFACRPASDKDPSRIEAVNRPGRSAEEAAAAPGVTVEARQAYLGREALFVSGRGRTAALIPADGGHVELSLEAPESLVGTHSGAFLNALAALRLTTPCDAAAGKRAVTRWAGPPGQGPTLGASARSGGSVLRRGERTEPIARSLARAYPEGGSCRLVVSLFPDSLAGRDVVGHIELQFLTDGTALSEAVAKVVSAPAGPNADWDSVMLRAEAVPYRESLPARPGWAVSRLEPRSGADSVNAGVLSADFAHPKLGAAELRYAVAGVVPGW